MICAFGDISKTMFCMFTCVIQNAILVAHLSLSYVMRLDGMSDLVISCNAK